MPKDRTQNNLENNLDGFERVLRALILAGMDPKEAVKVAYHRYPVMRHLYKDLLDDLVGDFAEGYGKKQAAAKFEREAISAAMKKSWTDDGVNLSDRMYKNSRKVQAESAEVIGKAIKEGESAAKTAKKLFDGYGKGGIIPEQDIPEFIQEVKDLPVPAWLDEEAVAEWKAAIRHARKLIEQGTTPGLRAAYSEVMDAIENGAKQNVSKAIDTAVQEKTRYTAERIARTERARAYADGVMAKYLDDPDIVAFQWKLSDRHPKCDICDVYAHADLHGLGKGIFPKDKFPKLPAHPHCLCRIKPIVDGMIDMSRQKDNVNKGGKAYIDTLPKREQERLLGVHGRNLVNKGFLSWSEKARGISHDGFNARVPVPESLKAYVKNGKVNVEKLGKRLDGEAVDDVIKRVKDYINSPFFISEYVPRQGMHTEGHKLYKPEDNKSYYEYEIPNADVIKAIKDAIDASGIQMTKNGNWSHKVLIDISPHIGYTVNKETGELTRTNLATVHISNKGIHIVPRKER